MINTVSLLMVSERYTKFFVGNIMLPCSMYLGKNSQIIYTMYFYINTDITVLEKSNLR